MPGRVEWSELGGDEAETVLANLLYSECTSSTRVRPSRGDFGIDVLDPSKREAGKYDVYQIKRYAKTLTASQKKEVEKSFRRVLVGLVRREPPVPLGDWYLIAPVDNPVDKQLDWFHPMPDRVINEMFEDAELALTEDEKQRITAWRNASGRIIKWEGSCPGSGVNREHGRRFRFTTCKSAKKESRPCLFEYQPPTASAPKSTPCLPRIGSFRRSLKKSPAWAPSC